LGALVTQTMPTASSNTTTKKSRLNDRERKRQLGALEEKIEKTEDAIKKLEFSFAKLKYGMQEFDQAQKKLIQLRDTLKTMELEWQTLSE
jgi:exonuclease VII small subunit